MYMNDLIVQDYGAFGEPEVHKIITVPIKKGDEFILKRYKTIIMEPIRNFFSFIYASYINQIQIIKIIIY